MKKFKSILFIFTIFALSGCNTYPKDEKSVTPPQTVLNSQKVIGEPSTPSRSAENIREIMEANRNSIFTIYNLALGKNPKLQGLFVVKFIIGSSGVVERAEVIKSELGDSDLELRLLERIKSIDFGAFDVAKTTINYTFKFFPS